MPLRVINPFALSSAMAAAPSGRVTALEGGALGAQREPILQIECPLAVQEQCGIEDGEGSRLGPHSGVRRCPSSRHTLDLIRTYRALNNKKGGRRVLISFRRKTKLNIRWM